MPRLYLYLRALAVAIAFPAIALYILAATLLHVLQGLLGASHTSRPTSRVTLRLWMSVLDWVKGLPVGYSYWEQFEAPVMLDEIAVHHDD